MSMKAKVQALLYNPLLWFIASQPANESKQTMTIRWGMIGTGDVTERKSGPALYLAKRSELIAVTNRTLARAED